MNSYRKYVDNLNLQYDCVNPLKIVHENILPWYDVHHRFLPWRFSGLGRSPNPYYILVSEIMLQQTTVATVKQYYNRFIEKWPTIDSLAQASEDEVLTMWQGLGYYRRARLLLKCAQEINKKGYWPHNLDELKTLPGIGDYTSAAIASIAFNHSVIPLDGNIIRVLGRFTEQIKTKDKIKKEVESLASKFCDFNRSGDFCQSLMDLGAMICKPRKPSCCLCPLRSNCKAFQNGTIDLIPAKKNKSKKILFTNAYCIIEDNKIFLQKNTSLSLLKNMMLVPMDSWAEKFPRKRLNGMKWKKN